MLTSSLSLLWLSLNKYCVTFFVTQGDDEQTDIGCDNTGGAGNTRRSGVLEVLLMIPSLDWLLFLTFAVDLVLYIKNLSHLLSRINDHHYFCLCMYMPSNIAAVSHHHYFPLCMYMSTNNAAVYYHHYFHLCMLQSVIIVTFICVCTCLQTVLQSLHFNLTDFVNCTGLKCILTAQWSRWHWHVECVMSDPPQGTTCPNTGSFIGA